MADAEAKPSLGRRIRMNVRKRFVSGILLLVPLGVTLLVMRWLYGTLVGVLEPLIRWLVESREAVPLLSSVPEAWAGPIAAACAILLLLAFVYLVGLVGYFFIGRKILALVELVLMRLPVIRTVYGAVKQVIQSLAGSDRTRFRSVVLVEFPCPGMRAIGFSTGAIETGQEGAERLLKVFIPTAPNPTSGFLEFIPESRVVHTNVTVEEAFRTILSGGILCPDKLARTAAEEA